MNDLLEQQKQAIAARHGRKKRFQRVLSVLAAATVFVTTYALILPAITLERELSAAQAAAGETVITEPSEPVSVELPEEPASPEAQPEDPVPPGAASPGRLNPSEPEITENVVPETEPGAPVPSEPAVSEPGSAPESSEPGAAESGVSDPAAPPVPEPGPSDPGVSAPGISEPGTSGPGDSGPGQPETAPSPSTPGSPNPGQPAPSEPGQTESEQTGPQTSIPAAEPEAPAGDPTADVESRAQWENTFAHITRTGNWAKDVLAIADTQLGYAESTRNFISEHGRQKGYTRYGAWYGSPYGDWCAMFVSFCLHYAEVDRALMPIEANCPKWIEKLKELKYWRGPDYVAEPGDLIFFDWERDGVSDHVGLVYDIIRDAAGTPVQVKTIEGNSADRVQSVQYALTDAGIAGYGELPENPNPPEEKTQPEKPEAPKPEKTNRKRPMF